MATEDEFISRLDDSAPALPDDSILPVVVDREFPTERLIGCAGSGKSYTLNARMATDSSYGVLTATTGISAINIGAVTLHSALRVTGDPDSLRDAFISGRLAATLHKLAADSQRIVIEEYSMLHASQLDIIYRAVVDVNRYTDMQSRDPFGILLCGDLAQLPPVKGEWCFRAECWPRFAASTTRLTKVWRQDGGPFLDALNLLREGKGRDAADLLSSAGARWESQIDNEFDGTTILPKNAMVSRHNDLALARVPGPRITVRSRRWGKQDPAWGENSRTREWGIPQSLDVKLGALVMILSNRSDFSVVNGDTGTIEDYDAKSREFTIRLLRNNSLTTVSPILRAVESIERPDSLEWRNVPKVDDEGAGFGGVWHPQPHYRRRGRRFVAGQVEFYPLRLAYATTVHKSQGLTLDRTQIDFRDRFFGMPAMLYVAMSRCRTLEGIRLVGSPERFAGQCMTDPRIAPWI